MDRPSFSALPQTIQEKYDATIVMSMTLTASDKTESRLLILRSNTVNKVAILLNLQPIEFDEVSGDKSCWVEEWNILEGTTYLLIGRHNSPVLDIYDFTGKRVGIDYVWESWVQETAYYVEKERLDYTNTPFILRANLSDAPLPKHSLQ